MQSNISTTLVPAELLHFQCTRYTGDVVLHFQCTQCAGDVVQ